MADNPTVEDCFACHKVPSNDVEPFKRCSSCKMRAYCTKACQKKNWKDHHKNECKALAGGQVGRLTKTQAISEGWGSLPTADPDSVFFLKISVLHLKDISFSSPYADVETLFKHMKAHFVFRKSRPGEVLVDDLEMLKEFKNQSRIESPIPGGYSVVMDIIPYSMPSLAYNLPCASYMLFHATALTLYCSPYIRDISGTHRKIEDMCLEGVYSTLDDANKAAKTYIDENSRLRPNVPAFGTIDLVDGYSQGFIAGKGLNEKTRWFWVARDDGMVGDRGLRQKMRFNPGRPAMMDEDCSPPPGSAPYMGTVGEMRKDYYKMLDGWTGFGQHPLLTVVLPRGMTPEQAMRRMNIPHVV